MIFMACTKCGGKNIMSICDECYREKDRQVNDLLTTVRQLKACMREATGEIDLALLAKPDTDLAAQSNSKEKEFDKLGGKNERG